MSERKFATQGFVYAVVLFAYFVTLALVSVANDQRKTEIAALKTRIEKLESR